MTNYSVFELSRKVPDTSQIYFKTRLSPKLGKCSFFTVIFIQKISNEFEYTKTKPKTRE